MSRDEEMLAKPATAIGDWPLNAVAWSGSRYVAVGSGGIIISSADGISWNVENSPTTNSLDRITWSGSRFIAVGGDGTALVSPDGTSWTCTTTPFPGRPAATPSRGNDASRGHAAEREDPGIGSPAKLNGLSTR